MRAIRIVDGIPTLDHVGPSNDEGVTVAVTSASICGSDLHMIEMGMAEGQVLGHEFCGTTPDGTLVAVEPFFGCGTCGSCTEGFPTGCATGTKFLGLGLAGGFAEQVTVPAATLVPLPSGISPSAGSLVETLAVAVHGIERARISEHDRVLVIGAGPVGLATVAVLAHNGIRADVAARHSHQQTAVETLGGSLDVDSNYDVVIDAVATSSSLRDAVRLIRHRGLIGMVGTPWEPAALEMTAALKEVEVVASMGYRCTVDSRDFTTAAHVLAATPAIESTFITHRFPLDGCREAFTTAADRSSGTIKVAFDP